MRLRTDGRSVRRCILHLALVVLVAHVKVKWGRAEWPISGRCPPQPDKTQRQVNMHAVGVCHPSSMVEEDYYSSTERPTTSLTCISTSSFCTPHLSRVFGVHVCAYTRHITAKDIRRRRCLPTPSTPILHRPSSPNRVESAMLLEVLSAKGASQYATRLNDTTVAGQRARSLP